MSARADLTTKDGNVMCRVVTDYESVLFRITPVEAMGLAKALHEYGFKVLHAHASAEVKSLQALISDLPLPPQTGAFRQ